MISTYILFFLAYLPFMSLIWKKKIEASNSVPSLVEIGQMILEKIKLWKVYNAYDSNRQIFDKESSLQQSWSELKKAAKECLFIIFLSCTLHVQKLLMQGRKLNIYLYSVIVPATYKFEHVPVKYIVICKTLSVEEIPK